MATCEPAPVRLVVVGHVDHGKSTLIGRLFFDTNSLPDGRYEQLAAAAARRGSRFEYANLTDALQAERDQNVTIDAAHIRFASNGRQYVIIDAPGHKEFVRNMVTGAAQADAAMVVIDAQEGVLEQSRRHGFLLALLGLTQVVVVINKMDLVNFSEDTFQAVASEYRRFLASIGVTPLEVIPICARTGANVARIGDEMAWYSGPTVLDAFDRLAPATAPADGPLRFPIQDVFKFDHRRILAGRLESGVVRVGDRLVFQPSGRISAVKTIERWSAPVTDVAAAGESIGLTLTEQIFIDRGDVACLPADSPLVRTECHARVFWLGRRPLTASRGYVLRLTTQEVECEVVAIERVIDGATLEERPGCQEVSAHDVADVRLRMRRPLVFDPYGRVPTFGRFVLVDELDVAGGGIVTRALPKPAAEPERFANLTRSFGQVAREERHARNGHRGAIIWFTGLSGSGKSTVANALEREMFDRGLQVFVLDGDNIRYGLSANLTFSAADRAENIRRVAETAKLFAEAGIIAVTAFISPYRSDRSRARRIMEEGGLDIPFVEVFLDTPVEVCEQRDPKHLYAKARRGEIKDFTGVSAPYERPDHPDLVLDTSQCSVADAVTAVLDTILPRLRP